MTIYNQARAVEYDEKSRFDKGDRQKQLEYLKDVIDYLPGTVEVLVELGCGTGFYSRALLERYPSATAFLLDGSAEMLTLAKASLSGTDGRARYVCSPIESWDYGPLADSVDLVFAGVTLCFLDRPIRQRVVASIHSMLRDGGVFLLIDQFCGDDERHERLLENLRCRDLQRRMSSHLKIAMNNPLLRLDKLVERERSSKVADGDREITIEEHLRLLRETGFGSPGLLFMEPRMFGMIAYKAA